MDSIDALDVLTEMLRGKKLREKEAELALKCRHEIMNVFVGAKGDAIEALNALTYLLGRQHLREKEAELALECRRLLMCALQGVSSDEVYIHIVRG